MSVAVSDVATEGDNDQWSNLLQLLKGVLGALEQRARPAVLRVVEVRGNGRVVGQGRCGGKQVLHAQQLVPCHLPDIDPLETAVLEPYPTHLMLTVTMCWVEETACRLSAQQRQRPWRAATDRFAIQAALMSLMSEVQRSAMCSRE